MRFANDVNEKRIPTICSDRAIPRITTPKETESRQGDTRLVLIRTTCERIEDQLTHEWISE